MKRDTRQEILYAAKALFNERGFNSVSIRDIADELGISKGNLTYHFKKKEEIMEAIITEVPGSSSPLPAPKTIGEMNNFFLNMQRVVRENAFYFWHHAQLSQLSPKIREHQSKVYENNFDKFTQGFYTLQKDGMFREEAFQGEYERIIDTLILSNIYWMPFCALKGGGDTPVDFQYHAWSILYPLLTEKGRSILQDIVKI